MKFGAFFTVCAVASATFKTLEEVYGPVQPVSHMEPLGAKASRTRDADSLYRKHRMVDLCDFPFEILLVQDSTDSFTDDYDQMKNVQLDLMYNALKDIHPDTRYGLLSFRDKPVAPFGIFPTPDNGYYSDYCVKTEVDFSSDITPVREAYAASKPNGGGDAPESQFTALMAATQSSFFSWSANGYSTKLIVMITDAPPHFDDDGLMAASGMTPFSGRFDDLNAEAQCTAEYYPTPLEVKHELDNHYSYLATLVYDPDWWNSLPVKSWEWFNNYIGQTSDFINMNAADSSNFWPNLAKVIKFIEDLECIYGSTATPTPTATPAPTTTPEPTVTIPGGPETLPPTESAVVTAVGTPITATPAPTETAIVGTPITATPTATPECPPCPEPECPPCNTPPPRPDECEETVLCDHGVYINIGFKPNDFALHIDGQDVPLPTA